MWFEHNITNLSANKLLGLDYFTSKIFTVDVGSDEDKFYNRAVLAAGEIACEVHA